MSGANTYSVSFSDVVDLVPDDWAYAYYTDASGNQIYTYANSPVTNAWKDFNQVWGYVDPKLTSINVTLKNASNATRASTSFTPSPNGYWSTYLWNGVTRVDIAAGDRVEVVPSGGSSMNVPVPGLTTALDISTDSISGSAPANSTLHTYVWRWLGSSYSGYYYRSTTSDSGGSYSASPGVDVVACDYGETWYVNPDGNRVYVRAYTSFGDSYEPDDTYASAKFARIDGTALANHNFHVAGDYDWFKFHVCAGVQYVIETFNLGYSGDTYLQLYDTNGTTVLREDDDSGDGLASRIEWRAPAGGLYYVKVRHYSPSRVGCDTNYDFKITAAESGGVDLYTTSVIPVQVLEGQSLVLNKATALKVIVGKSGSRSLNDVQIKVLPAGGGELTTFYVDEPANRDAADDHLNQPNGGYPLNFCPGDTSKTIYFFGNALAPTSTGSYHALVQVDYPNAVSETNENNNLSLPSQILDVKDTKWSGMLFPDLFIQYFRADWGNNALTDFDKYYQSSGDFLRSVYPVAGSRFTTGKSTDFAGSTSLFHGSDGRLDETELGLWVLATLPQAKVAHPAADRFLAIMPRGWFASTTTGTLQNALGVAYPAARDLVIAEARATSRPNGPSIAAHEIGHSYGLNLSCEDYDPCNPARQDGIGSLAGTGIWVDRRIPIEITSARRVYSFMGAYADREFWSSIDAYSTLYNDHQASATTSDASSSSQAILAVGRFYLDGTVQLDNWYILPEAELSTLAPGPYIFEYQDAGGAVLYQKSFDVSFTMEGETLNQSPFVFTIPYVNGTARVVVKRGATTLAQKVASAHAPTVTVLSPNGNEQLRGGTITVSWTASDIDGDALSYTVLYSANNGATWELIAGGLSSTSTTWSVQGLPASSAYRIKVVATDGFNTGFDVSDATFTVIGRTYLPMIVR